MRPTTLLLSASILALAASPISAQGTSYALVDPSYYVSGCTGPSLCACPAIMVGPLSGSFALVPILPQLGPIFEFTVVDFDVIAPSGAGIPMLITGGGLYTIDLAAETQTMSLDLIVDGAPMAFESVGAVPVYVDFPASIDIGVFSPIAPPCIYDGLSIVAAGPPTPPGTELIRGDFNQDGSFDIADPVAVLAMLFPQPPFPPVPDCDDAADANDDGTLNIADPIALLGALFGTGPLPPAPFPSCGGDPTADSLACTDHAACP
jgi:hypothetical protein